MHDDTRRLRRMLRPVMHLDPHTGVAVMRPRARVLSATVTRRIDRWYVCLNLEAADYHRCLRHQPRSHGEGRRFVGIDRGPATFAVVADSSGVEVCRFAPRPPACRRRRLRRRSRALSRTQRGSRNRVKAARMLAREHTRIANIRRNFLHEISSKLAKTHSELAVEDLPVANLIRNKHLAQAITDAAWAEFARQLRYKTAWLGGSWSCAIAGFLRPRPAPPVAQSRSRWRWGRGPFVAVIAGRSGTGLQRRRQSRRLGRDSYGRSRPGSGPPSRRPDHSCPWRGRRWPSLQRWRNRPHERGTDAPAAR